MNGLLPTVMFLVFAGNPTATHFEFFNGLSGNLEIELSESSKPIGGLANQAAPDSAEIVSMRLNARVYDDAADNFRAITAEEYEAVAHARSQIQLQGESGETVTHNAPNGRFFTVRELLDAVVATERQTRGSSEWFDGVDIHHVWFEGISPLENGVWEISWGS